MTGDRKDEEIVELYKNGEKKSFKELVDKYTTPLYNFAARMTNKNEAPDIVQEIFIKAWKNIGRFDPLKASFKTWIFTIARNTTTDFLRKKKSLLFSDLELVNEEDITSFAESIPDDNSLPDVVLQKLQDGEFFKKILDKVRPAYREILVLHYQEEMTFEEIGKILNKPLNTVKSSHRRAILELRKIISASP